MKTLLILAALIGCPGRTEQLRITIYDKAHLNGRVMDDVSDKLRRIFREARIEAEIVVSDPDEPEASLMVYTPQPAAERRQQMACLARRDIALSIAVAPRGLQAGILGTALPLSTTGLNTRVFVDHVAATAYRENRSFGNVLAHAMAHEIGHVLLRSAGHEGHGIMASPWTAREYDQMTVLRTMFFSREHSARMRDTLAGRDCDAIQHQ